jgi:hypothetical protein
MQSAEKFTIKIQHVRDPSQHSIQQVTALQVMTHRDRHALHCRHTAIEDIGMLIVLSGGPGQSSRFAQSGAFWADPFLMRMHLA